LPEETLKTYAKHIRTDACFNSIVDIKKAIRNKDEATALVCLGELREQVTLLNHYIDALEKNSNSGG
jgi:hypothetical protein